MATTSLANTWPIDNENQWHISLGATKWWAPGTPVRSTRVSWLILVESMLNPCWIHVCSTHTLPKSSPTLRPRLPQASRPPPRVHPTAPSAAAAVAQRRPQPHQRLPAGTQHDAGNASSLLSLHADLSHGSRCGGNPRIKVKFYGWCWILCSKRAFSSIQRSTTETMFSSFWSNNRQNLTVTFWRAMRFSFSTLRCPDVHRMPSRESLVWSLPPPLRDPANAKFFCAMPKPAFAAACSHSTDLVITMQWHLS